MKAHTSLQSRIDLYLAERIRLGYCAHEDAWALPSFARYVQAVGHRGPLTVEVMAEWARCDSQHSTDPHTWARRLKKLRMFMRWLKQFEPLTEVPDNTFFGSLPERQTPHIYSDQEIVDLLSAARRLGPAPGLRGLVYETLFGLLASTGVRIGEALALRNSDVDLKTGMLSIHQAKFGKSRQVPIHPSTLDALRRYCGMRDLYAQRSEPDGAFFIGTRGRRRGLPLGDRQVHRIFSELRKQLDWHNRGTHLSTRIHDLRHTFIVRRIVQWQAMGVDIDQAMLSLSTYVGHAKASNTYWYMSAVPQMMEVAASRFESFASKAQVHDE